jgi:hypothetical protein
MSEDLMSYSLLSSHYPLPITHYPLPITHYPLPITHYPLPITHYPLPITYLFKLSRIALAARCPEIVAPSILSI